MANGAKGAMIAAAVLAVAGSLPGHAAPTQEDRFFGTDAAGLESRAEAREAGRDAILRAALGFGVTALGTHGTALARVADTGERLSPDLALLLRPRAPVAAFDAQAPSAPTPAPASDPLPLLCFLAFGGLSLGLFGGAGLMRIELV